MRTELWNNHEIRFAEVDGEWLAVAKDVSDALDYANTSNMVKHVPAKYLIHSVLEGMNAKSLLLTEFGIYKAIFGSHKKEAEDFQEWVFTIIQQLRESSGLEGFEIFRTLDREHQRRMMNELNQKLSKPVRLDFMKANTIANKAVSNEFGYQKMVKKGEMTPDMLKERENVLEDTVTLMALVDKYHLNLSVSQTIYNRKSVGETA